MDSEEKVKILAWRHETVILKKSAGVLIICDDLVGCCT